LSRTGNYRYILKKNSWYIKILSANDLDEEVKLEEVKVDRGTFGFLALFLIRFLKAHQLNTSYNQAHTLQGLPFIDTILGQLRIKIDIDSRELQNIPIYGAFIAIANHPFGGLDSLLLLKILATARPDFKIIANAALKKISNIEDFVIPVNPFKMQYGQNIPGMRKVLSLVQNDMPIGIFPAGDVSGLQDSEYSVIDPEWHPGLLNLLAKARVPVLPIYFSGSCSLISNLLNYFQPSLPSVQLPINIINKEGLNINIRIGKPIAYTNLARLPKADVLPFLRAQTYALGVEILKPNPLSNFINALPAAKPIIAETNKAIIKAEILKLPSKCFLYMHQQYQVYTAQYKQIPQVMRELGRLREITYRAAGEGTNQETDQDLFDPHYHHLFVYDTKADLLVGAYRIGKGKEIYNRFGKSGFYLHSLFKIDKEFTPILKKSLELGRSFVRAEYQKKSLPWFLLWKGISVFLEGKTNYSYLLGPVSISDYFSATSKTLIVNYIQKHFFDPELARLVSPRKKFRYRASGYYAESLAQKNIPAVKSLDELLSDIKPKHLRLPVLLKKYLQQNARIIGFNIDPKFSNSLDGFLIMQICDLPGITQALLAEYSLTE